MLKLTERLDKYDKIYIYDIRLINCELDIGILFSEILNNLKNPGIGMAFIPNTSLLDENWYHNLLYVLEKNAYVIWEDLEGTYSDYIRDNPEKFSFWKFGILQFEGKQKRVVHKGRYMLFDSKLIYEEKKELIHKARHIQIYQLRCDRIGEEIRVLNKVLFENNDEKDIFKLYIPIDDYLRPFDGTNVCFNELIGRRISLLRNKEEYALWIQDIFENSEKYKYNPGKIDVSDIKCGIRNMDVPVIDFYDNELVFGRKLVRDIVGLNDEYVCLFIRDAEYLRKLLPEVDCSYHNYRDASFAVMNKTIDYFDKCGIQTIRMGQITEPQEIHAKCIDFAKEGYDEFLDLSILRNNKFLIGTGSGITELPNIFGKPVLWLLPYYPLVDHGLFYVKECLGIFNRIYNINTKRELSFLEIFDVAFEFVHNGGAKGEYFKQQGLELIPFSEDDILEAAIEMNEKLDKVWEEQEEDVKLRNMFTSKLSSFFDKHNIDISDMVPIYIAISYLRKYKYLLED